MHQDKFRTFTTDSIWFKTEELKQYFTTIIEQEKDNPEYQKIIEYISKINLNRRYILEGQFKQHALNIKRLKNSTIAKNAQVGNLE